MVIFISSYNNNYGQQCVFNSIRLFLKNNNYIAEIYSKQTDQHYFSKIKTNIRKSQIVCLFGTWVWVYYDISSDKIFEYIITVSDTILSPSEESFKAYEYPYKRFYSILSHYDTNNIESIKNGNLNELIWSFNS